MLARPMRMAYLVTFFGVGPWMRYRFSYCTSMLVCMPAAELAAEF